MRERLVIELPDLHSFHSLIGGSNPAHNHEIRPADADLISWLGLVDAFRTFTELSTKAQADYNLLDSSNHFEPASFQSAPYSAKDSPSAVPGLSSLPYSNPHFGQTA